MYCIFFKEFFVQKGQIKVVVLLGLIQGVLNKVLCVGCDIYVIENVDGIYFVEEVKVFLFYFFKVVV